MGNQTTTLKESIQHTGQSKLRSFGSIQLFKFKTIDKEIFGINTECNIKDPEKRIRLRHPNFLGALAFDHGYLEVFGLYNKGLTFYFDYNSDILHLDQIINQKRSQGTRFKEEELMKYAQELLSVLNYLEQNGVGNGDLQPATIFIDPKDNSIKLIDTELILGEFAGFRIIDEQIRNRIAYATPEIVYSLKFSQDGLMQKFKFKNDIFALGLTLLEMCTLLPSTEVFDIGSKKIFTKEIDNRLLIVKQFYSEKIAQMIKDMLIIDPRQRLSSHDLLEKFTNQRFIFNQNPNVLEVKQQREPSPINNFQTQQCNQQCQQQQQQQSQHFFTQQQQQQQISQYQNAAYASNQNGRKSSISPQQRQASPKPNTQRSQSQMPSQQYSKTVPQTPNNNQNNTENQNTKQPNILNMVSRILFETTEISSVESESSRIIADQNLDQIVNQQQIRQPPNQTMNTHRDLVQQNQYFVMQHLQASRRPAASVHNSNQNSPKQIRFINDKSPNRSASFYNTSRINQQNSDQIQQQQRIQLTQSFVVRPQIGQDQGIVQQTLQQPQQQQQYQTVSIQQSLGQTNQSIKQLQQITRQSQINIDNTPGTIQQNINSGKNSQVLFNQSVQNSQLINLPTQQQQQQQQQIPQPIQQQLYPQVQTYQHQQIHHHMQPILQQQPQKHQPQMALEQSQQLGLSQKLQQSQSLKNSTIPVSGSNLQPQSVGQQQPQQLLTQTLQVQGNINNPQRSKSPSIVYHSTQPLPNQINAQNQVNHQQVLQPQQQPRAQQVVLQQQKCISPQPRPLIQNGKENLQQVVIQRQVNNKQIIRCNKFGNALSTINSASEINSPHFQDDSSTNFSQLDKKIGDLDRKVQEILQKSQLVTKRQDYFN